MSVKLTFYVGAWKQSQVPLLVRDTSPALHSCIILNLLRSFGIVNIYSSVLYMIFPSLNNLLFPKFLVIISQTYPKKRKIKYFLNGTANKTTSIYLLLGDEESSDRRRQIYTHPSLQL